MRIHKSLRSLIIPVICVSVFACAATKKPAAGPDELLLSQSQSSPPGWVDSVPEHTGRYLYFVGLSGESESTEKLARKNALGDAVNQLITYYGVKVVEKSEEIRTYFGLASKVIDPTIAKREFENTFKENMAEAVKIKEIYKEKWQKPTGTGWKVYALCHVPRNIADKTAEETLSGLANDNLRKAQKQARDASDQAAKNQAENFIKYWEKMKGEGMAE